MFNLRHMLLPLLLALFVAPATGRQVGALTPYAGQNKSSISLCPPTPDHHEDVPYINAGLVKRVHSHLRDLRTHFVHDRSPRRTHDWTEVGRIRNGGESVFALAGKLFGEEVHRENFENVTAEQHEPISRAVFENKFNSPFLSKVTRGPQVINLFGGVANCSKKGRYAMSEIYAWPAGSAFYARSGENHLFGLEHTCSNIKLERDGKTTVKYFVQLTRDLFLVSDSEEKLCEHDEIFSDHADGAQRMNTFFSWDEPYGRVIAGNSLQKVQDSFLSPGIGLLKVDSTMSFAFDRLRRELFNVFAMNAEEHANIRRQWNSMLYFIISSVLLAISVSVASVSWKDARNRLVLLIALPVVNLLVLAIVAHAYVVLSRDLAFHSTFLTQESAAFKSKDEEDVLLSFETNGCMSVAGVPMRKHTEILLSTLCVSSLCLAISLVSLLRFTFIYGKDTMDTIRYGEEIMKDFSVNRKEDSDFDAYFNRLTVVRRSYSDSPIHRIC